MQRLSSDGFLESWVCAKGWPYLKRQALFWVLRGCRPVIWIARHLWGGRDKEAETAGCA